MGTSVRSSRAAELTAPDGVSLSVMVIDYHLESASSLAELLEFCGYMVAIASSGQEALQLADPLPNIVITELRLPDIDGYELVRRLRERAAAKPLLIVAVSCRQRDEDNLRSTELGVDLHYPKPADPEELLVALARFARTFTPRC